MAVYKMDSADKNFSAHFRDIQSFYGMTTRDMASLLNYKSASNIHYFTKIPMTNRPSYQALVNLQQLSGISLDWLFGLSPIPFAEETLEVAEKFLEERLNSLSLDFTDKKFSVEQKLQSLIFDLLSTNACKQFTLNDRFVLLFLINFLDNELCKAYAAIEVNREEKYNKFKVMENQKIVIRKYPGVISTLELFHEEMGKKHTASILSKDWDFNAFIQRNR